MIQLFQSFIQANKHTLAVYVLIMCFLTAERVAIPHFYGKLLESIKHVKFSKTTQMFCIVVGIFVVFQVLDTILTYIDAKLMPHFEAYVRRNQMRYAMCYAIRLPHHQSFNAQRISNSTSHEHESMSFACKAASHIYPIAKPSKRTYHGCYYC